MRHFLLAFCLCGLLTACAAPESSKPETMPEPQQTIATDISSNHFTLNKTSFDELPGWQTHKAKEALDTFLFSCTELQKQNMRAPKHCPALDVSKLNWHGLCIEAQNTAKNHASARDFFARYFDAYASSDKGKTTGLLTGYYIPEIKGSPTKTSKYSFPVYGKPADLKAPYFTRSEIYAGALRGKNAEIAWTDDPVGLFFLEVQGSGIIRLDNGQQLRIGYAGNNGHDYVTLGRVMEKEGMLQPGEVNLFTIKEWLYKHPDKAKQVMAKNPRYIFFEASKDSHVRGAQRVPLTAARSLAVDKDVVPYGLPIYINTELPATKVDAAQPFNQLMIAQDTGSAIKGGMRGDVYFGSGERAEQLAGHMAEQGRFTFLLPRDMTKGKAQFSCEIPLHVPK